jgi:hypothetical protein
MKGKRERARSKSLCIQKDFFYSYLQGDSQTCRHTKTFKGKKGEKKRERKKKKERMEKGAYERKR